MKKLYMLMMAGLAACAVACQEKPLEPQAPETSPQESRTMTFTAIAAQPEQAPASSAVLDGKKTLWENGDGITIFASNGHKAIFTTTLDAPSANATFTGQVEGEFPAPYTAVYGTMEQSQVNWDNDKKRVIGVEIKAEQSATENTFDKYVMPAIAEVADEHSPLNFKQAATLLKFTVGEEGVNNVTFWGRRNGSDKNVNCAGTGALKYNSGEPMFEDLNLGYARINAGEGNTLKKGATYFMVINSDAYDEFTVELNKAKSKQYTKPFTFYRGHIVDMGELTYVKTPFVMKGNKAAGFDDDSWSTEKKFEQKGDYAVMENVLLKPGAQFAICKDNAWFKGFMRIGNWFTVKDQPDNIVYNDPEGTYDIYVKEGTGKHQLCILPAGSPAPADVIPEQEGVVTVKVAAALSVLNGRNHIHFWAHDNRIFMDGNLAEQPYSDTEKTGYRVWTVENVPAEYIGQAFRIILKEGQGWETQKTNDSAFYFLEEEMYFGIDVQHNVATKVADPFKK